MPLETRKVLWISLSALILVLAVAVIGMLLFMPARGQEKAPASIAGTAPPRAVSPDVYSYEPAPVPTSENTKDPGQITVIYGQKPDTDELVGKSDEPASAELKPYTPAPAKSPPTQPASSPATSTTSSSAASSTAKTGTYTEFWIQAGSFTSRARAEDLQRELASKGLSSTINVKDIDGQNYYPVRVGPYTTKNEADGWLGQIKSLPACADAYVSQVTISR